MQAMIRKLSFIVCLLFPRCPFAISGLIVSVVVDALNSKFWGWPSSHIGQEIFKRGPSLAARNSSSAITGICLMFWICAALTNVFPAIIFWRLGHPVFYKQATTYFPVKATTTLYIATDQFTDTHHQVG